MPLLTTAERIRRKLYIKDYLLELGVLAGRSVDPRELGTAEEAAQLRAVAINRSSGKVNQFELPFSALSSSDFNAYIQRLRMSNPTPIQIWTRHTIECGVLTLPSIADVKFDFGFSVDPDGVLAFATQDMMDSLLLDFFTSLGTEQVVQIEARGPNWSTVSPPSCKAHLIA